MVKCGNMQISEVLKGLYRSPRYKTGLAKKREILIFPKTAGNTGIYWEILGNKIDS